MKRMWCSALAIGAAATAAVAAPDGVPTKTLTAFQPFRLSLATPRYDITPPPPNATTYPQYIGFEQPARVTPTFNTVYMDYDPKSFVRIDVGPRQGNQLFTYSWDFSCRVGNVSKLVVFRSVSGPSNPASFMTVEVPVVNDTATFSIPNYTLAMNTVSISTRPEYKNKDYFAWTFSYCDVKPVAKSKLTRPLPKP